MKKKMLMFIRGKSGAEYIFTVKEDDAHLSGWQADGLPIHEISNIVPGWVASIGLTRPWCWLQDRWQWLRLY